VRHQNPTRYHAWPEPFEGRQRAVVKVEVQVDTGEPKVFQSGGTCREKPDVKFKSVFVSRKISLYVRDGSRPLSRLEVSFIMRKPFKRIEQVHRLLGRRGQHDHRRPSEENTRFRHISGNLVAAGKSLINLYALQWRCGGIGALMGAKHFVQHLCADGMPVIRKSIGQPSGRPLKIDHESTAPIFSHAK